LTATGSSPCSGTSSSNVVITIEKNPVVSAISDQTVCEDVGTVSLSGTNTGSPATYQWTSSGTGTFSAPTALSTTYTPSAADIASGSVTITLTATGINPCSGTSSQDMTLTIIPLPLVSITVTFPI
jgi:hypothetical protein